MIPTLYCLEGKMSMALWFVIGICIGNIIRNRR